MMHNKVSIWVVLALGVVTLPTLGTTNYWDNNGDTAGFGTAGGTWGTESKWSTDGTGASASTVTNTTAADDLIFGTGANGLATGTITVDGTNQAFRSMTFGAASGTIILSNGTINLAAPVSSITVNNTSNTISTVLTGPNGLEKRLSDLLTYTNFLTSSFVTLFTTATLSNYVDVAAAMAGGSISAGPITATPYYFTNNGTNATVQMQAYNGGYTKCVKVELTQSGPAIFGRALYAKYHSSGANVMGYDFDAGGTGSSLATSYATGGYGISQISLITDHVLTLTGVNTYSGGTAIGSGTLEIGGAGQLGSGSYAGAITNSGLLLYTSTADQSLRGVIAGSGSLVKDSSAKVSTLFAYTNFLPETPTLVTVVSNAALSEFVGADGIIGGTSVAGGGGSVSADAYFFTNLGATVTYQLQGMDGAWLKCVKVELTQSGVNIAARVLYSKYISNSNPIGFDFDTGGNTMSVATSYSTGGYGAAETYLTIRRYSKLTLYGTNTYSGGTVVNRGVLEAVTNAAALPSSGGITVNNAGELVLRVGSMAVNNAGGVGNGNPITVNSGGTLTLAAVFNAGNLRPITINGGTLNSIVTEAYIADNGNYINNLTLKNGAQVIGYMPRMGYFISAAITVSGTKSSSIAAGLNLVKQATEALTLTVEDVTGNADTDLSIPGVIRDYPGLTGLPIIKTGTGTVSISGSNTHIGPITVTAGTFALATNNTLNTGNNILMNGGTLNMGAFTNTVGTLTVLTNSVIMLGSGRLAFADSSATGWTNSLSLTGTLDSQTLRFGTNATALTSVQLSAIQLNGKRVRIKIDGYLAPTLKGTFICVW